MKKRPAKGVDRTQLPTAEDQFAPPHGDPLRDPVRADPARRREEDTVPPPSPRPIDPLSAALRRWPMVAAVAAAFALLLLLAGALRPERFRASAVCAVTPVIQGVESSAIFRGVEVLDRRSVVATVAALATTPRTLASVVPSGAEYEVVSSVLPNTNLVRIDVEGRSAPQAVRIANSIPPLLAMELKGMYGVYEVRLVSPAAGSSPGTGPGVERLAAAGVLGGLLVGVAAAWMIERQRAEVR